MVKTLWRVVESKNQYAGFDYEHDLRSGPQKLVFRVSSDNG